MAPRRARDGPASKTLPERVGQLYYAYGLFCSSHPVAFISFACTIVVLCCYPLLNLPLPGNVPQHYVSPVENQTEQGPAIPAWLSSGPLCYIQQIIVKTAVSPWTEKLVLTDAFRAPLSEVFTLLEHVRNYQHENSSRSLSHVCLHVEAVKSRHAADCKHILPEYNCLVLSPANLWHQNFQEFQQDSSLLSTVFSYVSLQKSKMSLAEMLFGLKLKDTGIKRYPLRTRQRTLQYAVTLVLQDYDRSYISGLRKQLAALYPLHQESVADDDKSSDLHVYYPGEFHWRQLIPLFTMYVMLFLYVYFSLRKVELVRCKVGMALSAVATALASLLMSAGLCCFFGLTLTINWREMYPYLVMVVGLENVLVLSKSVLSTPAHLDVKIRVAQGLSKEGWSITNNLLTEVTILTFGLLTFVPAIQRFCIFAVVGLLSDFFLQMSFFATVLSIYIHRQDSSIYRHTNMPTPPASLHSTPALSTRGTILRSKSHPRLNGLAPQLPDSFPTTVVAPVHYAGRVLDKIPKRLRLVHFWARTRFFQRSFMLFMVAWIAFIAYNSEAIESFFQMDATSDREWDKASRSQNWGWERKPQQFMATSPPVIETHSVITPTSKVAEEDLSRLHPNQYEPWDRLSPYHWAAILSMYNISVSGRFVTVLPAVRLSHAVAPQDAIRLRNPDERVAQHFQWQTLAAALDPLDFSDGDLRSSGSGTTDTSRGRSMAELPLIPSSPMELFLLSLLCVVSVLVLAYFMVLLYRCVCSRNYAEWRSGWLADSESTADSGTEVVLEAVPLVLEGHPQEVECMASDGSIIVSSCLAGQLRAWDAYSGECLVIVDRKRYFTHSRSQQKSDTSLHDMEGDDSIFSDYESGSPPSYGETGAGDLDSTLHLHVRASHRHSVIKEPASPNGLVSGVPRKRLQSYDWSFPDLRPSINTNFSSSLHHSQHSPSSEDSKKGYDFGSKFRDIYRQHHHSCASNEGNDENEVVEEECSCGGNGFVSAVNKHSVPIPVRTSLEEGIGRRHSGDRGDKGDRIPSGVGGGGNSKSPAVVPPIWCLDCRENLVVIGCANGRLEFWEAASGQFKCLYEDPTGGGVTSVKLIGNRVVAARLSGTLDFFALESYSRGRPIDWGFTAYRRTHVRSGSAGSLDWDAMASRGEEEDIRCLRLHVIRAHQQPITVLNAEGGRVLTGSQDHTLKVFRLEDHLPLYTLHGHCGPITCLFIDRISPMTAGSGSQDGLLCVWDLLTGACMYSIQAHDGAILALTYSASYVISVGADERLCVWERFQGHLLNTIQMVGLPHVPKAQAYCSSIVMLTHSLLLTSKLGSLVVWDVRAGEPVRMVRLGHSDSCVFVKQLLLLRDSVVCDYGNQLRIVRFPLATDKTE